MSESLTKYCSMRDALIRARAFVRKIKNDEEATQISLQIDRTLAMADEAHGFDAIAREVQSIPNLEDFIVQRTFTRDEVPVARVPSSDAWQSRMPLRDNYRIFLRTDKGFAEREGEDPEQVLLDTKASLKKPWK